MIMEESDQISRELKVMGRQLGFTYPSSTPEVDVFGKRKKLDYLAYMDKPSFTLPDFVDVMKGSR